MNDLEIKPIKVILNNGVQINFKGKYRRDLEKPNWHYYEDKFGHIMHFKKESMAAVLEGGSYTWSTSDN